jgi:hypothetical protein
MTGRMIVLLLGLSLLSGCGRSDHPTIRHVSLRPQDSGIAAPGSTLTADDMAECPGSSIPHMTREKRDLTVPKDVDAAIGRKIEEELAHKAAGKPATTIGTTPPSSSGRVADDIHSREVRLGDRRLVSPETWTREQPPIDAILASFRLPRAQGDATDAQLTVTAAGQNDPKSLQRLREELDREPRGGAVEHLRIGDGDVVLVANSGKSSDPGDTSSPPVAEGRYRVLNATVFLGGRVYLINCSGPEKTVAERAGEFRGFLQSMKSVD